MFSLRRVFAVQTSSTKRVFRLYKFIWKCTCPGYIGCAHAYGERCTSGFKWHTDSITVSTFACAIPWEGSFCKSPISATTFVIWSWDFCIAIFGNVMLMSRSKTETVFHGCLTPGQLTLILAMPHFGLDVIYVQIALNDSKTRSLGTNRWLL